jgi:large subunit ribosomal protein L18e
MVTMSLKVERKSNPYLKDTILNLSKISREAGSVFWRDIAERLSEGRERYASINLGKIDRLVKDGETVVVPGSVLGSGYFEKKKVTVSALSISEKAREKLTSSGSKFITLEDLAKDNPKGTNFKILR